MSTDQNERALTVNPQRILIVLGALGIAAILLSALGVHMRFFPGSYNVHNNAQANFLEDFGIETNFNLKHNVAVYFGMFFMSFAAYLAFIVVKLKKAQEKLPWALTAAMVFFLSVDNLADILQKANSYIGIETGPKSFFPVSEIIVACLFILLLVFLWKHADPKTRGLVLIFAVTYFSGSLLKEFTFGANKNLVPALYMLLAQALQYTGEIILSYAFLNHLAIYMPTFGVSLQAEKS